MFGFGTILSGTLKIDIINFPKRWKPQNMFKYGINYAKNKEWRFWFKIYSELYLRNQSKYIIFYSVSYLHR